MKTKLLFLVFSAVLFMGCGDDLPLILQYDGDNLTGPILEAGLHEAAARFPASSLEEYDGYKLSGVEFFMGNQPASCKIIIYGQGSSDTPGAKIFEVDVTSALATPQWNEYTLDNPIDLGGEDIWISIALEHDQDQQSIGCDAGPGRLNGDWLFSSSDGEWIPYSDRTPESINWNIRGKVTEE